MKEKELNNLLRNRARQLGLCDRWYKEWSDDETMQQLLEKYLRGIDFCIKHDYPNIDFVRVYFSRKLLFDKGIFLDEKIDVKNTRKAVTLGKTSGRIKYEGLVTGDVYVRHQSTVEVSAKDGARVFVEVYDGATVNVCSDEHSKIFVYDHGGNVETHGNVTVRNKREARV